MFHRRVLIIRSTRFLSGPFCTEWERDFKQIIICSTALVREASGLFVPFLKIISKMFDGFKEKCYLCRRNEEINDSYS